MKFFPTKATNGTLVVTFLLACTFDPSTTVKEANEMTEARPWHEHTLESQSKTIATNFVYHPKADTKEICVALDVGGNSDLKNAYDTWLNNTDRSNRRPHNNFLTELERAEILCISRYRDNRTKTTAQPGKAIYRRMFSYFDGQQAHRVTCYSETDKYTCRDGKKRELYVIDNPIPFLNHNSGPFSSVTESILAMEQRKHNDRYSRSRKLLSVSSSWLTREQKAFAPSRSREKPEYKYENVINANGNQQKVYNKKITNSQLVSKKTGKLILPECSVSNDGSIKVTGFGQVNECLDEITPWQGFCKFWSSSQQKNVVNEKKINACKLGGRGILIKQNNDQLLRVTGCEYQPASQHFYCSGKLERGDPSYKVYFERYGVDISDKQQDPNCPKQQTLLTDRGASNVDYDETTTDSPTSTIDTGFVKFKPTGNDWKHQHCFAFDVEPDGELQTAWRENRDNQGGNYHKNYLEKASLAKVLCISRYATRGAIGILNRIKPNNMYSYYTGGADGKDHLAICYKRDNDDFICKAEDSSVHVLISGADVKRNFARGSIADKILAIEHYDENKKIMRLKGRHLANKQIAHYPSSSQERPEYDYRDLMVNKRDQRRYVKVIDAIKSRKDDQEILPMCQGDGSNITGFEEKKVCASKIGIYNHYCKGMAEKIKICKLKGRGILIKKDNGDLLRVTSCEYQTAAGHFYCSGKIDGNGNIKVYYERYGVYAEKVEIATTHRCPNTETIVRNTEDEPVPIPIDTVEENTSVAQVPVTVVPPVTTPDCQADTTIDNCNCNSPLITHGGECLSKCPDGYDPQGNSCEQVEQPIVQLPDCTHNQSTTDCNCPSTMAKIAGRCCHQGEMVANDTCFIPIPPCKDGQSIANSACSCGGKIYDQECYTTCPTGTSDPNNDGVCIKDIIKCELHQLVDSCDDCSSDDGMQPVSSTDETKTACCKTVDENDGQYVRYTNGQCETCQNSAEEGVPPTCTRQE